MLWSKWIDAKATGTEVDIPVDPGWKRHDLYIGGGGVPARAARATA